MKKREEKNAGRPRRELLYPMFSNGSHIEIDGGRNVIVEGCEGILRYENECIKLSLGSRALLIIGSELCVSSMFGKTICVRGSIHSVEFV